MPHQRAGSLVVKGLMALAAGLLFRRLRRGESSHALPALLASAAAVLLHLWKGNDLLSIFGATVLYMVLVQGVFN